MFKIIDIDIPCGLTVLVLVVLFTVQIMLLFNF